MTFHHFGLLSSNPEDTRKMLINLGYEVSTCIDDPLQNVRAYWGTHLKLPCVEIIAPTESPGPLTNLARKLRQGIYHMCFEVSDLAECIDKFSAHGRVLEVSPRKPAILFGNRMVSFYSVENFGLIEILESEHVRTAAP